MKRRRVHGRIGALSAAVAIVALLAACELLPGVEPENDVDDPEAQLAASRQIYQARCAACHQVSGEGTAVFPSLIDNSFVTLEEPAELIELVLDGRGGMPPFRRLLTDEEIAAVLSFLRNDFQNEASLITADQVAEARE